MLFRSNPEVARAMEQALVEAMVFCLAGSHSENARNVHRHRGKVMRRLEDALMANPEELDRVEKQQQISNMSPGTISPGRNNGGANAVQL